MKFGRAEIVGRRQRTEPHVFKCIVSNHRVVPQRQTDVAGKCAVHVASRRIVEIAATVGMMINAIFRCFLFAESHHERARKPGKIRRGVENRVIHAGCRETSTGYIRLIGISQPNTIGGHNTGNAEGTNGAAQTLTSRFVHRQRHEVRRVLSTETKRTEFATHTHHGFSFKDPIDVGRARARALICQNAHFQTHERFGRSVDLFRCRKGDAATAGTATGRQTDGILITGCVRLDIGIDLTANLNVGSHRCLRQAKNAGADNTRRFYGRQQFVFHKKILSVIFPTPLFGVRLAASEQTAPIFLHSKFALPVAIRAQKTRQPSLAICRDLLTLL